MRGPNGAPSPGEKAFQCAFRHSYRIATDEIHHLAAGKSSYNFTPFDWVAYIGISSFAIATDTVITVLAGIGLLAGYLSIGLSSGIALAGLLVNSAFNVWRDYQKTKQYKNAEEFLNANKIDLRINHLCQQIMLPFRDRLQHCPTSTARLFARKVVSIITDAVLYENVRKLSTFTNNNYTKRYRQAFIESITSTKTRSRVMVMQQTNLKEFKETFKDEFATFESNTRGLSQGQGAFSNSRRDWLNITAISSTPIVVGTLVGILGAIGIISGIASVGIGLAISLVGLGVGIAYNMMRFKQNKQKSLEAVDWMDKENMKDHVDTIADTLTVRFKQRLENGTPADAIALAKEANNAMTAAIMTKQVRTPHAFFHDETWHAIMPNTKPQSTFAMILAWFRIKPAKPARSETASAAQVIEKDTPFFSKQHSFFATKPNHEALPPVLAFDKQATLKQVSI